MYPAQLIRIEHISLFAVWLVWSTTSFLFRTQLIGSGTILYLQLACIEHDFFFVSNTTYQNRTRFLTFATNTTYQNRAQLFVSNRLTPLLSCAAIGSTDVETPQNMARTRLLKTTLHWPRQRPTRRYKHSSTFTTILYSNSSTLLFLSRICFLLFHAL